VIERPAVRPQPPPAISLADVYFILFRHKWKILIVAGTGILLALLLPVIWRLPFQSEAKLFIKYVLESKSPGQVGANDSRFKSPDEGGENIINTELEILTSLDLAQYVADSVGPQKILAKAGGGNDKLIAAALIHKNLLVEVPKKSNVIRVVFQHPDPEVVQPVLTTLIAKYLQAHAEIHRSVGVFDDFLSQETDQLRSRLVQTEDELRKTKAKAGILSLEDTKKVYTEQSSKIQQAIFDVEAELAERQAAVNELSKLLHTGTNLVAVSATHSPDGVANQTNGLVSPSAPGTAKSAISAGNTTNQNFSALAMGSGATNRPLASANLTTNSVTISATNSGPPSDGAIAEYRKVCTVLESLEKKEQELLVQFTSASPLVKSVEVQIAGYEKLKAQLEAENPGIGALPAAQPKVSDATPGSGPKVDIASEMAKVTALEAKIKVLNSQLGTIRTNASAVDVVEASITELQRKKELEEAHYKYFAANLEQSRIDEALGPGRVSNIKQIQLPSAPYRDVLKLKKIRFLVLFGSIAVAIGLAFVIELYLDRSLKRPSEIDSKLGLPLFISIPLLNGEGKRRLLGGFRKMPSLSYPNGNSSYASSVNGDEETSNGHSKSREDLAEESSVADRALPAPHFSESLRPFSEALRDRLISYFEVNNLTHKPKLVALTSCAIGSGVTTIASALAASLSETGDGNVLLVDMHVENGAAHDFHRGKLTCGLDEVLETGGRERAMVQDNLYVVKETTNGTNLPRVLPKRFNHLMPRLRASDYDYIIFDMPAVSQISVTSRLSRFMDMVLLVVESEKTDRDLVKRACTLLSEPKTNLAIVLNKRRAHVPRLLQQEL
jgi:uncharacterized protein involved in exopolysaccharide biosynthesis/Mrp family chromosome partitioning ATPase